MPNVPKSAKVESAIWVSYATLIARPPCQTSNGYFGAKPRQIQAAKTAPVGLRRFGCTW